MDIGCSTKSEGMRMDIGWIRYAPLSIAFVSPTIMQLESGAGQTSDPMDFPSKSCKMLKKNMFQCDMRQINLLGKSTSSGWWFGQFFYISIYWE